MASGDAPSRETLLETIMMSCPGRKWILFKSLIVMPNACLHLTRSACVIAIQNAHASNLLSLLDPMHEGQNCSRFSILSERSHYTRIHPLSHPSTRIIAKR